MTDQADWRAIFEASGCTYKTIAQWAGIDITAVRAYLKNRCICQTDGRARVPLARNRAKMEMALERAAQYPRIPRHKSHGYATPEQMEYLFNGGLGEHRSTLEKTVEQQTKLKGKYL
jgi:hypothetical protein